MTPKNQKKKINETIHYYLFFFALAIHLNIKPIHHKKIKKGV
jgi:hypothetical protein